LAYVPVELLKCVVFLGYINKAGVEKFAGSAFWVSRPGPEDIRGEYRPAYLVTAGHVIDDIKKDTTKTNKDVRIRLNMEKGKPKWHDAPMRFWEYHPDYPKVDLAMLKIGLVEGSDHVAWPLEFLVENENLDKEESDRKLELGDELFFAGLFWPHKGESRNVPIVRIGNISALRGEPVTNQNNDPMDVYLAESRSIGGISGSPVFIDLMTAKRVHQPSYGSMAAAHDNASPSRFRLVGIVQGHFDWEDKEPDSNQSKLGINMGIAMIVPAEKLTRGLEVFMEEEKKEIEAARKKKLSFVVFDSVQHQPNVTFQTTSTGFDVAVPSAGEFLNDLKKASRKKD